MHAPTDFTRTAKSSSVGSSAASFRRWVLRAGRNAVERIVFYQPLFLLVVAMIIGITCGFAAVGFHHLIAWFQEMFWGVGELTVEAVKAAPWWQRLLVPAIGGLLVGPVIRFLAPEAKGHGVPEVILAVAQRNGLMRGRVVVGKALASALTLASGGSAGREGPIIQIGAAIGSKAGQLLRVSGQHVRTFAGCGAAAGLAATFNAPIAATLFTVEVIIGEYSVLQFTPIVISAVIATVVSRYYWGSEPVFSVPDYQLISSWEFVPYILLGLISGFLALGLMRLLFATEDRFERWKNVPVWLKPAAGGLLLGVIGLGLPQVYGDGYDTVDHVLQGGLAGWLVALLLVGKLLATSLTLGSGGSGGVFMPSLFLGAMTGSVVGHLAGWSLGDLAGSPGGYALVGMGGIVAGAMHAPITAMVMMFELTGNYTIILPLMTVCILSTMVTNLVQRESIYTAKLARAGVDLFRGRTLDIFRDLTVGACMRPALPVIDGRTPASDVVKQMIAEEGGTRYVADDTGALHGAIRLHDVKVFLSRPESLGHGLLALDLADSRAPFCTRGESLRDALLKFERSGLTELPVVEPPGNTLIGVLPYAELIAHYNEEVLQRDTGDSLRRRIAAAHDPGRVPIAPGLSLLTWSPPPVYWGKTLAEAALPQRFVVQVVMIRKGEDAFTLPNRDYVIASGDQIIVCGRDDDLKGLPGG
jgi:CIC family chloride channel protein